MGSCGSQIKHIPKEIPTYGYTFGLRIGSYILSSSLQLGSKQRISSKFDNQIYLIGVIDTGCICGVIRLPPGDYCNDWLGMGDDKILGGASIQMVSTGIISLHMGFVWSFRLPYRWVGLGVHQRHTPVKIWSSIHPSRQNVVQHPPTWWRHQMETFSALLVLCAGNSSVPGEFPTQRPVTRSFDVFFDLGLNKRLRKHSKRWWFEAQSSSLWRHRNAPIGLGHICVHIYRAVSYITSTRTGIIFILSPPFVCLTALSYYFDQCWLIREFLWHSLETNFPASAQATILYNDIENYTFNEIMF